MHQNDSKLFISADSKELLVKHMHENNVFHSTGFQYDAPMKDGKKWVVWFTANVIEYANKEMNRGTTNNK